MPAFHAQGRFYHWQARCIKRLRYSMDAKYTAKLCQHSIIRGCSSLLRLDSAHSPVHISQLAAHMHILGNSNLQRQQMCQQADRAHDTGGMAGLQVQLCSLDVACLHSLCVSAHEAVGWKAATLPTPTRVSAPPAGRQGCQR